MKTAREELVYVEIFRVSKEKDRMLWQLFYAVIVGTCLDYLVRFSRMFDFANDIFAPFVYNLSQSFKHENGTAK